MKIFQKTLFFTLFLSGLVRANLALAALVPCGGPTQSPCTLCHLWQLGSNIINFLTFSLAIPAAALLFVAAGVIFLVSGGNEYKLTKAKTIFTNTVIGLLIVFCSWLLIDTLIKTIATTSTETGVIIWSWNDFPIDCAVGSED